ncbi:MULTISPECIES: sugar ABC transporter ATP-binding protein [unclassified Modestobacter]|uniref:sugar ABC transporter ATP-binding protein n=1 Tax=unclassified Modestobacter TaxID=2643866 RepID=UPI0022AABE5F|nr:MULTISPECIES: sugar ABC transporter ATP-binding protein [unclassified Modestobacter]MCZ2824235.1 sugar ABC transporter ATP-binding protein [Modestobacter sp. VKM Ac-2981]MCZ2854237.1 sugar ABC transporter ATP-binding protein [Modestobacter sp. VKM Ac-2982]
MLEAQGIRKTYGGVVALGGVDFSVRPGTVHALLGENGAGKSTLIKVLVGALPPDSGVLRLDGRELRVRTTADAVDSGIAVVSQELSLFPDLDVLANLFPMREPRRGGLVARRRMAEKARPVLDELGLHVDLDQSVEELALEQRQLLEIARALCTDPRVLVLDEPTSALHEDATTQLHQVIRRLAARDVAIVYVSHHLEDVLDVCDTVTIMRDGLVAVPAVPAHTLSVDRIVQHMLGDRVAAEMEARSHIDSDAVDPGAPALRFEDVTLGDELRGVDLVVPAGRVVGLAGVDGAGHRALLSVAAGVVRPDRGRVVLPDGRSLRHSIRGAIEQGVAIISGDRKRFGVMLDKSVWDNVAQVSTVGLRRDGLLVRAGRLRDRAQLQVASLGIKTPSVDQEVGMLSGGNQQKVVFAKWFESDPSVLLLDDPTRGIDVGAKAEIYKLLQEQSRRGAVQLVASSDPRELAAICDEVAVFHEGRICARLSGAHLNAHTVLEVMNTGVPPAIDPPER